MLQEQVSTVKPGPKAIDVEAQIQAVRVYFLIVNIRIY